MVLIAIDKHSRKILGYLCRNNLDVAYCCSDCDIEFTTAYDLEQHMVVHENLLTITQRASKGSDLDDVPLNVLSDIEREKQLKDKYQVTPCTVQLFRFDDDDDSDDEKKVFEMDIDSSMVSAMNNTNQENMTPSEEQLTKRRPGPASKMKEHNKTGNKDTKKLSKKQSPPAVCYLCGLKFHSTLLMEQHQKTHIQSSTNFPVFPCKVCGKNVKNLKLHLRQHKNENKNKNKKAALLAGSTANPNVTRNDFEAIKSVVVATPNGTKVEEASSSTDAVVTNVPDNLKEPENGITQSHDMTETPTFQSIVPPIVIEEFSLRKILSPHPINESEPSQSTQQTEASIIVDAQGVSLQHPSINETDSEMVEAEKIIESKNTDKKVQCDFCNKVVGRSYKRIHVKKYHTNIPSDTTY